MSQCKFCEIFEAGWEIENTPDDPYSDRFPKEFASLESVKQDIDLYQGRIYQCPHCKQFYRWSRSTPGGSVDALKTYIVDRLLPISKVEAEKLIAPPLENPTSTIAYRRCPSCHSGNVVKVQSGCVGGEVFITYQCLDCGKEDTLDETQLESWCQ